MALDALEGLSTSHSVLRRVVEAAILVRPLQFRGGRRTVLQ